MRIFIAGGSGVIGRRAIPALVRAGHAVTAVGRSADKRAVLEKLGAHPVAAELFDPRSLRSVIAGHEVVINLATSIPPSSRVFVPGAWRENDRLRGIAAGMLADAAIETGVRRFIQESFAPAYPDRGDQWIDERTPLEPARYNRTVVKAESAAERFGQGGGDAVVLRFAFLHGPDSSFTLDAIRTARKGWAATFGSREGFTSSVSHDDAASAVVAALDLPPGTWNVTDDEPLRRGDYFDSLASALGVGRLRFPPRWVARVTGSLGETLSRSQRISNRKLREASAWRPAWPSVRTSWPRLLQEIDSRSFT